MIAAFAFDWWIFASSATVSGYQGWVHFISSYDAPWRNLQLAAFARGMILGLSERFLPFINGFREVPARASRVVLYPWNIAVVGNVVAFTMLVRRQQFGFSMIDKPMAQRIFARSVSLEQACCLTYVNFATFQAALNKLVGKSCGGPDDLIQLGGHV